MLPGQGVPEFPLPVHLGGLRDLSSNSVLLSKMAAVLQEKPNNWNASITSPAGHDPSALSRAGPGCEFPEHPDRIAALRT